MAKAMAGQLELAVLRAGLDSGLLEGLREPRSAEALAEYLQTDPVLTASWVQAAEAHGLIRARDDAYQIGPYVKWLMSDPDGEAARAMVGQTTKSYTPTLARLPDLLRGEERPVFGKDPEEALRVAAGSRVTEPSALRALFRVPGVRSARRILDVGCGEGTYLVDLLSRHRDAIATGVEIDPVVAEQTRQRVRVTEVSRRLQIEEGDFLELELPRGVFELALLNNNLHYFDTEARRAVLTKVEGCLAPGGVIAIQTPLVTDSAASKALGMRAALATFDLYLRSHSNLHGLPRREDLAKLLSELGFGPMGERAIAPGGAAVYLWAKKPTTAAVESGDEAGSDA